MYQALFQSVAPVLGTAGIRALFARSVKLTAAEFPWLGNVPIAPIMTVPAEDPMTVVQHVITGLSRLEPAAAAEVAIGLYATLLGLMTRLIGEPLVLQFIKDVLPAIAVSNWEETA